MSLGIEVTPTSEIWSIPINSYNDKQWRDNTWIVEHLRQLAQKIEDDNPSIYAVSIKTDVQYGAKFQIEVFPKK